MIEQIQFNGPAANYLAWQSFADKFGTFTDWFDGQDCYMADGIHILNQSGAEIVYVNFWACGKGVDLSTHNHANDPSPLAPAFAEVHWVIDGIAEVEAESLEDAEKIVNDRLSDFVSSNPDIEQEMGAKAIQGKGYLPGSEESD